MIRDVEIFVEPWMGCAYICLVVCWDVIEAVFCSSYNFENVWLINIL